MNNRLKVNVSHQPLACLLTERELAKRKELLRKEIFSTALKISETATGYRFRFKFEAKFILKLTELIVEECQCCPFLQFDLQLSSNEDVLLTISGPSGAKELVLQMAKDS